jgi:hypothetical protein
LWKRCLRFFKPFKLIYKGTTIIFSRKVFKRFSPILFELYTQQPTFNYKETRNE